MHASTAARGGRDLAEVLTSGTVGGPDAGRTGRRADRTPGGPDAGRTGR
jgi:hypothetical protein